MKRRGVMAGLSALFLGACSKVAGTQAGASALSAADDWQRKAQRFFRSENALVKEYDPSQISPFFRGNGSIDPQDAAYRAHAANGFADWRLTVGGLVTKPLSLSLEDIRNLPQRSQVTRHDCVEGWSAIGEWTGPQLGPFFASRVFATRRASSSFAARIRLTTASITRASIWQMRFTRRPSSRTCSIANRCQSGMVRRCECALNASLATSMRSFFGRSRRLPRLTASAGAMADIGKIAAINGTRECNLTLGAGERMLGGAEPARLHGRESAVLKCCTEICGTYRQGKDFYTEPRFAPP